MVVARKVGINTSFEAPIIQNLQCNRSQSPEPRAHSTIQFTAKVAPVQAVAVQAHSIAQSTSKGTVKGIKDLHQSL